MPKLEGFESVQAKLTALVKEKLEGENRVSVVVGYTAYYAIFVHENMEAHHPVGQAKFLEAPARMFMGDITRVIREALIQGKPLSVALYIGGLFLQREANCYAQ
jgi:hypothetical protein